MVSSTHTEGAEIPDDAVIKVVHRPGWPALRRAVREGRDQCATKGMKRKRNPYHAGTPLSRAFNLGALGLMAGRSLEETLREVRRDRHSVSVVW